MSWWSWVSGSGWRNSGYALAPGWLPDRSTPAILPGGSSIVIQRSAPSAGSAAANAPWCPEGAQELPFRPEDQAADHRVHAVRADDQVEAAGGAPLEGDRHAVVVLLQRAARVVDHGLDVVLGRLVQDRHQALAQDLDSPLPSLCCMARRSVRATLGLVGSTKEVPMASVKAARTRGMVPFARPPRQAGPHVDPLPPGRHPGARSTRWAEGRGWPARTPRLARDARPLRAGFAGACRSWLVEAGPSGHRPRPLPLPARVAYPN